jgi:hypothetical protein
MPILTRAYTSAPYTSGLVLDRRGRHVDDRGALTGPLGHWPVADHVLAVTHLGDVAVLVAEDLDGVV